jgi:hypothetical protein
MSVPEKIYAFAAILFEIGLVAFILLQPQYRNLSFLLPASFAGMVVNTILLFLIFRDIWLRPFPNPKTKFIWGGVVLFIWPTAIIYLLLHGCRKR